MNKEKINLSVSTLLVLAMTAVVPLAVATGFSNFERARHVVLVVMAALALISWGIGLVRNGEAKMASPGTMVLGGSFFAIVAASVAWSALPHLGVLSLLTWTSLGVVFLILAAPVGRSPEFLDWTTAVAAGTIGAGGLGLYEFFGGGGLTPVWNPAGIAGGFDSIAFATAYYVLAIPLLVGAVAVSRKGRRWFLAGGLLLGILHLGLVIDGLALGVLVAAMIVVGLVIRMGSKQATGRREKLAMTAAALTVVVALCGYWGFDRPDRQSDADDLPRVSVGDNLAEDMLISGRVRWSYFAADRVESPLDQRFRPYLNSVTRGLWEQEPVLGHGAGGWWLMQTDVVHDGDLEIKEMFDRYPAFKSPHSDYARILVEQGGLGLLLFLLFLAGLLTAITGGIRSGAVSSEDDRVVIWALATTVCIGIVMMYFLPVLELASSGVLWFGAAALAVAHCAQRSDKHRWLTIHRFGREKMIVRYGSAVAVAVLAVAMVIPAAQNGQSSLERGHADHQMLRAAFPDALALYEKSFETYPAHAETLYNQALAHRRMGDALKGEDAIQRAVEMRPYDARLVSFRAYVALRQDRLVTALKYGNEAVRTGPNYLEGYEVYSSALQRRGRYADTAALFAAVLERNPPVEQRRLFRLRYSTVLETQLADFPEALKQLKLAREELPSGAERTLLVDRVQSLERKIERDKLEEQGKPIPPELQEIEVDHGHDHHHHH